jgi:hypothetical protein
MGSAAAGLSERNTTGDRTTDTEATERMSAPLLMLTGVV